MSTTITILTTCQHLLIVYEYQYINRIFRWPIRILFTLTLSNTAKVFFMLTIISLNSSWKLASEDVQIVPILFFRITCFNYFIWIFDAGKFSHNFHAPIADIVVKFLMNLLF